MKKFLLFFSVAIASLSGYSQATCAAAITLTANGTYTTGTINGTYRVACYNNFTPDTAGETQKGYWYKFTPTANGEISISANLPTNDGVAKSNDTRLSVATGNCLGALTCVANNDDISNSNYKSEVTGVSVTAGTTYFIQWDNRWLSLPLDFTFTFTAVSCARPTVFYLPEYVSTSEVDLYWDQTTTYPTNYQVDWSTDFAAVAGTGTLVSAPAGTLAYSTATLSGLPASSNFRYFTRADCGTSQSTWSGPYYGFLPKTLPYTNDFNNVANNYTDGFVNFSLFVASGTSTPANYADGGAGGVMYTFNSTTAVSDSRAYFRGMSLQAGEIVTVTFKTRLYSAATPPTPSPISFNLTVGDSQSALGQATVVQSFTNSSATAYTTHTATYTATEAGVYYFGIHNNTPAGATETFLFLDTIGLSSTLSNESFLASKFSVYPNPSSSVINISNTLNAVVNTVEIADLNGRVVKTQNVNNTDAEISISDLSAGVYMLKVDTDQGVVTKKIVKQ